MSAQALKKMGAVSNLETGMAMFMTLDRVKVVQLEASSSGHWLLDLSEDIFSRAVPEAPGPAFKKLRGNRVD